MNIILLLLLLGALVFVHELGHFLVAKRLSLLVHTFSIGFRPTLFKKQYGETTYELGAVPLGGFVSIEGENPDMISAHPRALSSRPWWQQALVLCAGVFANVLFAWLIMVAVFMQGVPEILSFDDTRIGQSAHILVANVFPDSVADNAGIATGSQITQINDAPPTTEALTRALESAEPITLTFDNQDVITLNEPIETLGIEMVYVDTRAYAFFPALVQSAQWTGQTTWAIIASLGDIVASLWQPDGESVGVTGPVGITQYVADAATQGLQAILVLTAVISLNLAVLNMLPIPVLDGGRLVIITIETLRKKRIPPHYLQHAYMAGALFLFILIIWVTFQDVLRLVG